MQHATAKHACVPQYDTRADRVPQRGTRKDRGAKFALFAVTLFAMTCTLYSRFLFGNDSFIFVAVGSDSWAQSVPFFLNAADRFANLDFSTWDFSQFLGTQTVQAVNPEYLVSVFGTQYVGPLMLVSQMAKVFLTGIFFYLFTSYWNARYAVRFASSLGIAFCGRIIALAAWTAYTMEVLLAVCLLWAFERFLASARKFIALPIAFALMVATLGLYGTILYSFMMLGYVAFRLGYGQHRLKSGRDIGVFIAQLACLYIAGILLIAVTFFPTIEGYFDSARVASDTGKAGLPQIVPPEIYAAEALSLFAPAGLGSMADYAGPCNTLNNPYFYCGVAPLLGVPFAFRSKSRRQRIWIGIYLGLALVYIVSGSFRYILNGFGLSAIDFRMSSFWVTTTIAVLGMIGLNELAQGARPVPVVIACALYLVLLAAACFVLRDFVRKPWVALAVACLVVYAVIAVVVSRRNTPAPLGNMPASTGSVPTQKGSVPTQKGSVPVLLGVLFVAVCVIELVGQGWVLANNVTVATKDDYNFEYKANFEEIIDDIDGNEDDRYRIDYKTALLTRPMAYNFRGTQAYVGGTGFSKAQMEFMRNVFNNDYIEQMGYSRYMYGFYDNALNTLLGVRYLVYDLRNLQEDVNYYVPYGYHEIEHGLDGFRIYENDNALPFMMSYGYAEAQSSAQLLALPRADRASALFERCVVPDNRLRSAASATAEGSAAGPAEDSVIAESDEVLRGSGAVSLQFDPSNDPYLIVGMELESKSRESLYLSLEVTLRNGTTGNAVAIPYLAPTGNESISIPVANEGYTNAEIRIVNSPALEDPAKLFGFTVKEAPVSYFARYDATCQDKLAEKPTMSAATNDTVACSLDVADDGYIVTSVPWSESWRATIDGVEVSTFPVNYGFVGMETTAGHHDVQLVYHDTPREIGALVSIATLVGLIIVRVVVGLVARRRLHAL